MQRSHRARRATCATRPGILNRTTLSFGILNRPRSHPGQFKADNYNFSPFRLFTWLRLTCHFRFLISNRTNSFSSSSVISDVSFISCSRTLFDGFPLSVIPEVLEPACIQLGVANSVLDVFMPQVLLYGSRVLSIIRQLETG